MLFAEFGVGVVGACGFTVCAALRGIPGAAEGLGGPRGERERETGIARQTPSKDLSWNKGFEPQ